MTTVGGEGIQLDPRGVRHREPLDRREPQPAVAAPQRALLGPVALRADHPRRGREGDPLRDLPESRATAASSDAETRKTPRLLVSQK